MGFEILFMGQNGMSLKQCILVTFNYISWTINEAYSFPFRHDSESLTARIFLSSWMWVCLDNSF